MPPRLTTGYYQPSDEFKRTPEFIAVMEETTGQLIAIAGPTNDYPESVALARIYAQMFAGAPVMLEALRLIADQDPEKMSPESYVEFTKVIAGAAIRAATLIHNA